MRALELTFGGQILGSDLLGSGHPNEMKFKGVLVRLDEPSTRPPNGAEGHKIIVPAAVAKKRLKTLIGMGLNYDPGLDRHSQRRKVGVIKRAWIKGSDLWVEGVIWKHDFPEAQKDLKRDNLGMSMEINQVQIRDVDAQVWTITDLCFTGATILYKDAAAYQHTRAIAAKAEKRREHMAATATKKKAAAVGTTINFEQLAEITAKKVAAPVLQASEELVKVVNAQTSVLAQIAASFEQLHLNAGAPVQADPGEVDHMQTRKKQEAVAKKSAADDGEDDEDEDDEDEDDGEDMESSVNDDIDTGDLEEMGPDTGDDENDDDTPGQLNKGVENQGDKTTCDDKVGKTVESARVDVLRKQVQALTQKLNASNQSVTSLTKQLKQVKRQVAAAGEETNRRSFALPAEINGLLGKANLDGRQLLASGTKLSVDQVDGVLSAFEQSTGVKLDASKRMELKNRFLENQLMEDGAVDRGYSPIGFRR